jgi:hypothetical protein
MEDREDRGSGSGTKVRNSNTQCIVMGLKWKVGLK